jgi:predicted CXXCH cytochrome family protein
MMMPDLTRFLPALFAITLLGVPVSGCANKSFLQKGNVQSESCRSCHSPDAAAGAKDFTAIYTNPKSHHPVGVKYPIGSSKNEKFKLPNRQTTTIAFFDGNGNGQPNSDEIQLFGMNGEVTVECASCHKEHGGAMSAPDGFYLRVDNTASALCTTCHRQ